MLLLYLPPELASAPMVKKFVEGLSKELHQYEWDPRCPGCGAGNLWRDGKGARTTIAPVQRYRCARCGKRCCERTGTVFAGKHTPAAQVLTCHWLFLLGLSFRAIGQNTQRSHQTIGRWCLELELQNQPLAAPAAVWIGDETFVRVAGRQMYELKIVDWHGRTLARVLSPRRRAQEVQYLLQAVTQRYPQAPQVFMHDAGSLLECGGNSCHRRSTLLAALCRAMEIPARLHLQKVFIKDLKIPATSQLVNMTFAHGITGIYLNGE